jgi:hypothetical protein
MCTVLNIKVEMSERARDEARERLTPVHIRCLSEPESEELNFMEARRGVERN